MAPLVFLLLIQIKHYSFSYMEVLNSKTQKQVKVSVGI